MRKDEVLQGLVGVHNGLLEAQVGGDSIIIVAQALVTLRGIIRGMSTVSDESTSDDTAVELRGAE